MLQLQGGILTIALGIIMSTICVSATEELLELSCIDSLRCYLFERPGVRAMCIDGICTCINVIDGAPLKCKPRDDKLSNIITGPCPCTQPNTKCHEALDMCYCIMGHRPSRDQRRCIPKIAPFFGNCEEHEQCQLTDPFAICKGSVPICNCKSGFVHVTSKCRTTINLPGAGCANDTDCSKFGSRAMCATEVGMCVCRTGYSSHATDMECEDAAYYAERCVDDGQCQMTMGIGGRCNQGMCDCNPRYYVYTVDPKAFPLLRKCELKTERGQYCRIDEDCHELHRHEMDQLWDCKKGQCQCKFGPKAFRSGECTKSSSSTPWSKLKANLWIWQIALAMWQFV